MKIPTGNRRSRHEVLAITVIPLAILAGSALFLWPSPVEFPMDDTYIHFVYARNLSEQGKLFFNQAGERGVGTSSILWTLILAGGNSLGLSLHWVAKGIGIASLITVGLGLYTLLRAYLPEKPALVGSLVVALSGNMLWFALSGMETMLFLALAILAILTYRKLRWKSLGFLLGLLVLTRMEGVLLAPAIGAVDVLRHKRVRRGLLLAGVICALIGGAWILYLFLRTGYFLPTSGISKRFSAEIGIQIIAGRNRSLALISLVPALVYPITWFLYMSEFVLGGIALPPPKLVINSNLDAAGYPLSIWAIIGWVGVILPLCRNCLGRSIKSIRKPGWFHDERLVPPVVFFVWAVLHNLTYMALYPSIGTASRYGMMNHVALWLFLFFGLWCVDNPSIKLWLAAGLTVIASANTLYWDKVYDANLEHMLRVRISAADHIRENLPQSEKCAAMDVGAIRFYSGRPIVDLGGLIDPSLIQVYLDGKLDRYLISNGVTCLILPGRTGRTSDGWFDIAKEMGLINSNLFTIQQNGVFQIERERWLLGYLPVHNYQWTVTIYRLEKTSDLY